MKSKSRERDRDRERHQDANNSTNERSRSQRQTPDRETSWSPKSKKCRQKATLRTEFENIPETEATETEPKRTDIRNWLIERDVNNYLEKNNC